MIKKYNDFVNEELNVKKVIAGAALAGSLNKSVNSLYKLK